MTSVQSALQIRNSVRSDIGGIIDLCRCVYPATPPYTGEELLSQMRIFPEGQFVATEEFGKVVAMSGSLLIRNGASEPLENWNRATCYGTISNHDTSGDTLYGFETMVNPAWRRRGLGSRLFSLRVDLARRCGAQLFRGAGRLAGYANVSGELTPCEYLKKVLQGEIEDPSLSWILKNGFRVRGLAANYFHSDPDSLGWAAIVDYPIR